GPIAIGAGIRRFRTMECRTVCGYLKGQVHVTLRCPPHLVHSFFSTLLSKSDRGSTTRRSARNLSIPREWAHGRRMLLIAVALTVALVAADLLDLSKRAQRAPGLKMPK